MLAEGSHLWIELKPDGTTDGEFFTPEGAAPQPPERMVSMEGTWNVTEDDVVTLRRRYSDAERNDGKPDYE